MNEVLQKRPYKEVERRKRVSKQREQQAKGTVTEKAQLVSGGMAGRHVVNTKRKSEGFGINPVDSAEP